ncbi:type IV secretion system protein [Dyella sp. GSA-30]|uniref:type IV secretion system protein n=1 Tax=Dyella sp. GSA-30 TaxID=2994496 RepID=UPI002492E436|nr:type IV secretion system protein [Dyella sp. GSA-30]BDU18565.1 VirB6 type IV secretion protein [Dyella sp. GSA-30]
MLAINIANFFLKDVVETIQEAVNTDSANLVQIIEPGAIAMLTIYVLLWGAGIATGRVNEPLRDGIYRILRICFVVALGLTVGNYQTDIADFFLKVPTEIAAQVVSQGGGGSSLPDIIDNAVNRGFDIGNDVWHYADRKFGLFHLSYVAYYILAIIIFICVAIIAGIATAILFVAYIGLSVVLAVGPLFIVMAIFQPTYKFFDGWLSQIISFSVLFILVSTTISLCFTFMEKYLEGIENGNALDALIGMVKVIGATAAIIAALFESKTIASALVGGAQMSGQGLVSRAMGKAAQSQSHAQTARALVSGGSAGRSAGSNAASAAGRTAAAGRSRARLNFPR